MFLNSLEHRGIESTIGDASAYGRWLVEQYGATSSGVDVTEQTALTLPYAYASIKVLAETVAHVPLQIMKEGKKGAEPATNHHLYEMITTMPTDRHTPYHFKDTLEAHRNGWGNGYAEIVFQAGKPIDMKMLYPNNTHPRVHEHTDSVVYAITENQGGTRVLPASDVLHVSGMGFDGLAGYSPVQLAKESIGLGMAIHEFGASFFAGGATPKGIIETETAPNTLIKFIQEYKQRYGSINTSHETHILPKGMVYKPLTINPDDAQTLQTLKYNRTEVAAIYRVPPQFIMDMEFNTFTNASEMDSHFFKHTMIPIFTNWEQELNRKLLTAKERRLGYYFKFDAFWLLRGDTAARYAAYHQALQDSWLTRNEVRLMEEFPEREDMEEVLTPTNMQTPSDKEKTHGTPAPSDNTAPVVKALAERMVSNERKTLAKIGENISKGATFYNHKYPEFIKKHLLPIAIMVEHRLYEGLEAGDFMEKFINTYIDRQLGQMKESIGDVEVSERAIINLFYEILGEEK